MIVPFDNVLLYLALIRPLFCIGAELLPSQIERKCIKKRKKTDLLYIQPVLSRVQSN